MAYQKTLCHWHSLANPEIAEHSQRSFKTAAGEYGFGDKFLAIYSQASTLLEWYGACTDSVSVDSDFEEGAVLAVAGPVGGTVSKSERVT